MTRNEFKSNRRQPIMARLKEHLSFPDLSDEVLGDWDCARARMPRARH